jgi:hypothetical protein
MNNTATDDVSNERLFLSEQTEKTIPNEDFSASNPSMLSRKINVEDSFGVHEPKYYSVEKQS